MDIRERKARKKSKMIEKPEGNTELRKGVSHRNVACVFFLSGKDVEYNGTKLFQL